MIIEHITVAGRAATVRLRHTTGRLWTLSVQMDGTPRSGVWSDHHPTRKHALDRRELAIGRLAQMLDKAGAQQDVGAGRDPEHFGSAAGKVRSAAHQGGVE